MNEIKLTDLNDPCLEPYRDLKKSNQTRWNRHFIAEGRFVVERLLQSDYEIESVLVSEKKLHLYPEEYLDRAPRIILPHALMEELIGFNFHQGFLACGIRKQEQALPAPRPDKSSLILACPHITDPDNLGTIMRLARAFGVSGLIVGDQSTDPFSRRVIRVSMGNIFFLPIIVPNDFQETIEQLKREQNYQVFATVLDEQAESLMNQSRPEHLVLMFGNEANGLEEHHRELADRLVTIPMDDGTDSLNVALSAGIFLYHFTRLGGRS
ncbi:MAG: RNA methyltransferase [Planctomycetaceae bacterium]